MTALQHLAKELEALIILLQETHFAATERLVIANFELAKYFLSIEHGLDTFVLKRLNWTLCSQSPPTSDTKWLCVDIDGYKIILIYKPLPALLQVSDLPVFPYPSLYAGDFE